MATLTISRKGNLFEVDDKSIPGSPPVGMRPHNDGSRW